MGKPRLRRRRSSLLEERILTAAREVLPPQIKLDFDFQFAAITQIQQCRDRTGIILYLASRQGIPETVNGMIEDVFPSTDKRRV